MPRPLQVSGLPGARRIRPGALVPLMLQHREDREVAAEMGGDQGRGAVGVALVRTGAMGQQCFDGVEMAMLYGKDESRAAL